MSSSPFPVPNNLPCDKDAHARLVPHPPSHSAPSALLAGHCAGCSAQTASLSSLEHPCCSSCSSDCWPPPRIRQDSTIKLVSKDTHHLLASTIMFTQGSATEEYAKQVFIVKLDSPVSWSGIWVYLLQEPCSRVVCLCVLWVWSHHCC